ncbi:MAG: hypothetical protein ACPHBQ_03580, partial [Candidatus Poseidoniaceae archaeon]
ITAIIAFFVGMSFRHLLPPIVAALLASIGLYVGGCIILDLPMEYLNLESSLAPLVVIPSVIVSLLVQRWHKKRNNPDGIVTNEVQQQRQAVRRSHYHPELEVDTQWARGGLRK